MTTRPAALDHDTIIEAVQRRRVLSFVLLRDYLNDGNGASHLLDNYDQLWAAAVGKSASAFYDEATPFFWKNVSRCLVEVKGGQKPTGATADYLACVGFDSYFSWLPEGAEIKTQSAAGELVFPRLGVRLQTNGQGATISRGGGRTFHVDLLEHRLTVNLDDLDPNLRLPMVSIQGSPAQLLLASDPSLFEENYISTIAPQTDKGPALGDMIAKSLEVIAAADPVLGSRLHSMISWYVPLSAPNARTHNSMSVQGLTGVIFLSEAYNDILLAEAMVHEFYHNDLYLLQEVQSLYESSPGELLYSPFRPDPRPLDGLYHALYVFSGVADFLIRAEHLPQLEPWAKSMRHRRTEIVQQLRIGLCQLPRNRLTPEGERLIRLIEDEVAIEQRDLGAELGELPQSVSDHLEKWQASNPGLAQNIQLPAGLRTN